LVLDNISITIGKGQQIGIVGTTGCGKSTFLDVLMMLINPTKGEIYIDGKRLNEPLTRPWQKIISHVPQDIFLLDSSFVDNIAFNVPKNTIDMERVIEAAKQAQIHTYIDSTAKGYYTLVGERGGKLSGGQKQRIGIARALYKKSPLLILDEATSSLDVKTEKLIMDSIYSLNPAITVVMITHRIAGFNEYIESIINFSVLTSSELVASSRISNGDFLYNALAIPILCFCPPLNLPPLSPTRV
jgi:ATP-binding cassette subfamily B protein